MDGMLIIAIASAVGGWSAFGYTLRQLHRYRAAWKNQCALVQIEIYSRDRARNEADLNRMAASAAGNELRASRQSNAALAAKASDLTKQLIATRENLDESDRHADEAIALSVARWKQIEELQASALAASELIAKLTSDKAELLKRLESFQTGTPVA